MNKIENFKNDIKFVEIELFSYCNRTCWFCPNSFINRRDNNIEMPEQTYIDIIDQLNQINFDGEISYSRYNEPLSYKELFLKRIKYARLNLKNAVLRTNTNGDYIDKKYIEELHNAGLNQLFIQEYSLSKEYNHQKKHNDILKKIHKLGLDFSLITDIRDYKIEYKLSYLDMTIHIRSRNFNLDGSSRGNTIELAKDYTRTKRCIQPFNHMYIDYNGNVMICCALRSDIKNHDIGLMGNVNDNKLWDIFYNEKYNVWRKHHLYDGPKEGVCKNCKQGIK
jgi:hypothetical protein